MTYFLHKDKGFDVETVIQRLPMLPFLQAILQIDIFSL